jgi:hypothetical protein
MLKAAACLLLAAAAAGAAAQSRAILGGKRMFTMYQEVYEVHKCGLRTASVLAAR